MPTLAELVAKKNPQLPQEEKPNGVATPASPATTTPAKAVVSTAPKFGGFKLPVGTNRAAPVAPSPTQSDAVRSPVADSASADAVVADAGAVIESNPTAPASPPLTGAVGGLARLAALSPKPAPQSEPVPESGVYSLADIEESESLGVAPITGFYTDMVPAEMPPRELPPELTQGQQEFLELTSGIYTCMNDPAMFSNVIRSFMQELQQHNEYDQLLVDADVNAMMAGLRSSMGMAKIKKQEKAAPRQKKAAKTSAMVSTLDDMFDDSDFE